MIAEDFDLNLFIEEIIKRISPKQALKLLTEQKDIWLNCARNDVPYSSKRERYFYALCRTVSWQPELFTPAPRWVLPFSSEDAFVVLGPDGRRDEEARQSKLARAKDLLSKLGYVYCSQGFEYLGVPYAQDLIDKLVAEGKIPKNWDEDPKDKRGA